MKYTGIATEVRPYDVRVNTEFLTFLIWRSGYASSWRVGDSVEVTLHDEFLGSYLLEAVASRGFYVQAFARAPG